MAFRLLTLALLAASAWAQSADFIVIPGTYSSWIKESGKGEGGTSYYECPNKELLIGRQHSGDENGRTQYQCGALHDLTIDQQLRPYVSYASWSPRLKESGKYNDGLSRYECPIGQVMIGREHSGDENGYTRYKCAPFGLSDGTFYSLNPQEWGQWFQESGRNVGGTSSFTCPPNQVMTGRAHRGDENGRTQYRCAIPMSVNVS